VNGFRILSGRGDFKKKDYNQRPDSTFCFGGISTEGFDEGSPRDKSGGGTKGKENQGARGGARWLTLRAGWNGLGSQGDAGREFVTPFWKQRIDWPGRNWLNSCCGKKQKR